MTEPIIHITNLPESMVLSRLEELLIQFGPYRKIYMARDYMTGLCKGFAYVTFKNENDAAKAVQLLNDHVYDNSILRVEWSKSRMTVYKESVMSFVPRKNEQNRSNDPIFCSSPKCDFCCGDHLSNHCPHKGTSTKTAKLADVKPPTTTFKQHPDSAEATRLLNGHAYNNNVLNVKWSESKVGASKVTMSDDSNVSPTTSKSEKKKPNDPVVDPLKNVSKCDFCSGNHLSNSCALKVKTVKAAKVATEKPSSTVEAAKPGGNVSPSEPDSIADGTKIRITNLPETMTVTGFQRLIKRIGPCKKIYLGRDLKTFLCIGFAYVTFKQHADAARAIQVLNGHTYDNNVLNVEWSQTKVRASKAMVPDESSMLAITNKNKVKKSIDLVVDPLINISRCGFCSGNHLVNGCPLEKKLLKNAKSATAKPSSTVATGSFKSGKSVPPPKADPTARHHTNDKRSICISNLNEWMTRIDLEELVKVFGHYQKIYLASDLNTGLCKGFAYVTFKNKKDAAKAVQLLNGHGFDHLILNVEWFTPQAVARAKSAMVSEDLKDEELTSSKNIRKRSGKLANDIAMSDSNLIKYVPPYKEKRANKTHHHDYSCVGISNLPESMVEAHFERLVKSIGPVKKIFLARNQNTGLCNGFAFVKFVQHTDAVTAIKLLNGRNCDGFILKVEWRKLYARN